MKFSTRLTLMLIAAAIIPSLLIAVIVLAGTSSQLKRLEHQDAIEAVVLFNKMQQAAITEISATLNSIGQGRDFQLMELGRNTGKTINPDFRLPLFTLDFVEYSNSNGAVLISGRRPALVGRQYLDERETKDGGNSIELVYEADLTGRHPSLRVTKATESGFISGGLYLDGRFKNDVGPLLNGSITAIDSSDPKFDQAAQMADYDRIFYDNDSLRAILTNPQKGQFYLLATFFPVDKSMIFSNFLVAVGAVIIFSLILVIPTGIYFAGRTRRQLGSLLTGVARVAQGDFSHKVNIAGPGEFSDLADSFNNMMRQLNDYRDRLVISEKIAAWQSIGRKIAHEVKNPLTPISIAADDLRHSYHENRNDFDKILDDSTRTIKNEINRLRKLIDEFSQFAKMPPPEISRFEIDPWLKEIEILFGEDTGGSQIKIDNQFPHKTINADSDQLRQVLINLIKNSRESGASEVNVILNETDPGTLTILIEDNGPGYSDNILRDGIVPYFSTHEGGSGLGLVICQRIIHDHDGRFILTNRQKGGARAEIRLPLNR